MSLSPSQIATVAARSGHWDGNDLTIAVAIALAESGGDPNATNHNTNGSTDYGLFQINSIHSALLGRGNWADPDANTAMARSVFDDSGGRWTAWSSFNNQRYRLFMGQAAGATSNPGAYTAPTGGTESVSVAGDVGSAALGWIPSKLFSVIGGAAFMQRAGMIALGGFLLLFALMKTRQGAAVTAKVTGAAKSVGAKAAEVAAVA